MVICDDMVDELNTAIKSRRVVPTVNAIPDVSLVFKVDKEHGDRCVRKYEKGKLVYSE